MPIFKSKYPSITIPSWTIPELVFGVQCESEETKPAYIDGFTGEQVTFGEVKLLASKVSHPQTYNRQ
jgi:hypothetical protein